MNDVELCIDPCEITIRIHRDGDAWCVLIGENLQEGVAGHGRTINDAIRNLAQNHHHDIGWYILKAKEKAEIAAKEVAALRSWKTDAMTLLELYDGLAESVGGSLGMRKTEILAAELARLREVNAALLAACKDAKKHLESDLVEPGRTVFWKLVAAIAKTS